MFSTDEAIAVSVIVSGIAIARPTLLAWAFAYEV